MHFLKLPPDTLFGVRENYSMPDQNLQQKNKDINIDRLKKNLFDADCLLVSGEARED
jgi:hypothetical protein